MYNKILKKMEFIVSTIYVSITIAVLYFLLFDLSHNLIRIFIFTMLIFDVYFIITFYSHKKASKNNFNKKNIKDWIYKIIFIMKNIIVVLPFFVTLLTLLLVFNLISIENLVSRGPRMINLLTYVYPNLFFIYMLRIGQFYYFFSKEYNTKIISDINAKTTISSFILISIVFFVLYINFNDKVLNKIFVKHNNTLEQISYEANSSLSEFLQDYYSDKDREIAFDDFAKTYDIKEIGLRVGPSLYKSENYDAFVKKHFVFETLILKSAEFILVLSGKKFIITIYLAIIIYIIITAFIILPQVIITRFFMEAKFGRQIKIICSGFEDEKFNLAVDTKNMSDDEILKLSKYYNNIYLPLKYRDIYIKKNKDEEEAE